MDIQLEKINLIKMIAETDDLSIISSIKQFFMTERKDFWDELSEEQKFQVNASLNEFDEGKYSDFQEFIAPYLK